MNIVKFSVKNPVLVNLIMMTVIVMGTVSLLDLPRTLMPDIDFHWVYVITSYEGVSPDEIEKLISIPIEDAINNVDKIKMVTSVSAEGLSQISIQFENMDEDEYDKLFQELKSEIDAINNLPSEDLIEGPDYLEFGSDDLVPMLFVVVSGTLPEREMIDIAEDLRDDIFDLKNVARAELSGARDEEIWVEVDPERLNNYNLALNQVVNSIAMKNLNLPGGTIDVGRSEYILRTVGEVDKVEELENVIIRKSVGEGQVAVKDVAAVVDTLEEAKNFGRLDGKTAFTIAVAKKKEGNVVTLVDEIRNLIDQRQRTLPENVTLSFTNDMSIPVKKLLSVLESNAYIGLIMVLLILWMFIGWRNAVFAAIGIPVTFMATFIFLKITGNSLNGTSLFGLVLVLGIIVDDTIIVIENCFRYIQKGYSPAKAAIIGTKEVATPVLAATATTVAAFLPLMLVPGILGEFFKVMPIVVSLALIASLIEAFFILPSHVAEWSGRNHHNNHKRTRIFVKIRSRYIRLLKKMLRIRHIAAVTVTLLFFACIAVLILYLGVDMFAGDEVPQFFVRVTMPEGTRLEETDRIMSQLEKQALTLPESDLVAVVTNTGVMQTDSEWFLKSSVGQLTIELIDKDLRDNAIPYYIEELRAKTAGIPGMQSIEFAKVNTGPPVGSPIEIKVRGQDYRQLQIISDELKTALAGFDGVFDIRDDYNFGKKELKIKVDEDRASLYGLDIFQVASTVQTAFDGIIATKFKKLDEEIDVIVKYKSESRNGLDDLKNMRIAAPGNILVPLKDIASLTIEPGITAVKRTDRERAITVTANIDQSKANANEINKEIMEVFSDLGARHPGYSLKFGGEFAEFEETMSGIWKLFALGIFLIYIILGGQFASFIQPFIILYTIPFAFIGAIAGLVLIQSPFTIATMYGIVALSGIVVNDALVLISFINNERQAGSNRWRSILLAGSVRLRPIILTSVTTIVGLLPMAVGFAGKSATWGPLATVIVGGLFFSTIFTLFIIPCLVAGVDDLKLLFGVKSLKPRPHVENIDDY